QPVASVAGVEADVAVAWDVAEELHDVVAVAGVVRGEQQVQRGESEHVQVGDVDAAGGAVQDRGVVRGRVEVQRVVRVRRGDRQRRQLIGVDRPDRVERYGSRL